MNFGYSINQNSKVDMDNTSRDLPALLLKYEPSFVSCFGCGSCTATCTAGRFTSFNFRMLRLNAMRGLTDNLHAEAEKCMLCGKCQMICPRGVNTRNIILNIQRFKNSKIP